MRMNHEINSSVLFMHIYFYNTQTHTPQTQTHTHTHTPQTQTHPHKQCNKHYTHLTHINLLLLQTHKLRLQGRLSVFQILLILSFCFCHFKPYFQTYSKTFKPYFQT